MHRGLPWHKTWINVGMQTVDAGRKGSSQNYLPQYWPQPSTKAALLWKRNKMLTTILENTGLILCHRHKLENLSWSSSPFVFVAWKHTLESLLLAYCTRHPCVKETSERFQLAAEHCIDRLGCVKMKPSRLTYMAMAKWRIWCFP